MKFNIYFLTRFFVAVVAIGILQIAFIPSISAVDNNCTSTYPTCVSNPDTSIWNCTSIAPAKCQINSSFSLSDACCKPAPINGTTQCGTTKGTAWGTIVCSTPGGDISQSLTRSYIDCNRGLTDKACCPNVDSQGSARCAQLGPLDSSPVKPGSFDLCAQTGDPGKCNDCKGKYVDDNGKPVGLWTAIGCINPTKEGITSSVIKLGLGIGGGVVLLMILAASFKLTTSKGDPKATEEAKEMITNAIGGLLFILFSVVLIRTIGRGLLQIPGF